MTANAVTLTFSGTVTTGLGSIVAGDTLTGSLAYDETATARPGGTAVQATFDAVTALTFAVNGFGSSLASATGAPEIQIDDGDGTLNDRFGAVGRVVDGMAPATLDGIYSLTTFSFRLDDTTDSAISNALILPSSVDLADYTSSTFFLFFTDASGGFQLIDGTLDRVVAVAPVPLPAGLPLLLGGLAGLGMLSARRRRSKS